MKLKTIAAGISVILLCQANAQNQSAVNPMLKLKVGADGAITITPMDNNTSEKNYNLVTTAAAIKTSGIVKNETKPDNNSSSNQVKDYNTHSAQKSNHSVSFGNYFNPISITPDSRFRTSNRVNAVNNTDNFIEQGSGPYFKTQKSSEIFTNYKLNTLATNSILNSEGLPNLLFYGGEGSDNTYHFDNTTSLLTANISVANNGTANAGTFRVGFYLSTDSIIQTSNIYKRLYYWWSGN